MITGSNNPFACNPVVFANANSIVSLGTITRSIVNPNQFIFSVGFKWKINGVLYQNTAPITITIAEASEGFQRIDNALLNTSNTIELQQGLESDSIALQPVAPDTNIILTSWNISGDAIGDTETPIVGTQFKQKNENQKFNPTLGGTTAVITIQPFGQNYYSVGGPVTGIVGFSKALITASPTAEVPYAGKDFYIENKTDHNFTLKNAFLPVDIPFNLGADLVVPTNGIVWLKYNPNTEKMDLFFKSWSEVDLSTKLNKDTTAGVERVYIINPDGSQGTKATSEFGGKKTHVVKIAGVFSSSEARWLKSNAYDSFLQPTNSTDVTAGFASDNLSISSHAIPFNHKIVGCFFNCFNNVGGTANLDVAVVSFEFPNGGNNGIALRTNSALLARKNITFGNSISPNFKFTGAELNTLYNGNENALVKLYIKNLSAPTVVLTSFQYCLTLLVEEI